MLQKMQELIRQENIYMDSPPFFGIDEHACDPGYEPNENDSKQIREGKEIDHRYCRTSSGRGCGIL